MSGWWQQQAFRLDPWWVATYIACVAAVIAATWVDWWPFRVVTIIALAVLVVQATVYWGAIIEAHREKRETDD